MCQLCAHYAHLYRLCITHIWHSTSTLRHCLVYITNMLLSSVPSVINSDVMSVSDWLLLSYLPVLTTATSSLRVSWCPVHISAAAVSPSCGNTYCDTELEAVWSRFYTRPTWTPLASSHCEDTVAAFFKSFRKGFVVCRGLDANLSGKVVKKNDSDT